MTTWRIEIEKDSGKRRSIVRQFRTESDALVTVSQQLADDESVALIEELLP